MQKITSLAKKLQHKARREPHLANLTLRQGEIFGWDHTACAITYNPAHPAAIANLLHEFGHATLDHQSYQRDIELIAMERAAWDRAKVLGQELGIALDTDTVEDALDTYRDWLHARATCPTCTAAGIQTDGMLYTCLACHTTWHVNEARTCALRRRVHTKKRP